LNITCANHVINMTPWWNYSVEEQAFGRVYRHGQKKETYFVRIAVKDSIDDRLLKMQEKKEGEILEAMKEGKKLKPLTVDECIALFGGSDDAAYAVEKDEESDMGDDSNESDYVD
jgi:SNF2 family DNA or RNA helicase